MPHVVVHYTANLGPDARIGALCETLRAVIVARRDGAGARLFPLGGTRVLADPAEHFAVADGGPDRAFVYVNVRIASGRDPALVAAAGEALGAAVREHFAPVFARRPVGITLQIDEGAPVFDVKHSNLHPLFKDA
jgi:5-carboxymethyl-2-hydroxymuconate isomerase